MSSSQSLNGGDAFGTQTTSAIAAIASFIAGVFGLEPTPTLGSGLVSSTTNAGFESPSTANAQPGQNDSPGITVSPESNSDASLGSSLQSANPSLDQGSPTTEVTVQTSMPGAQDPVSTQTVAGSSPANADSPQNAENTVLATAVIVLPFETLTMTQLPMSSVSVQSSDGSSAGILSSPPSPPASPVALTPALLILPSTTLSFGDILTTGSQILSYGSNGLLLASQPTSGAAPSFYSTFQFSPSSLTLSTSTPNFLIDNPQSQPSTVLLTLPSTTLTALQTFIPASEGSNSVSSSVAALVLGSQGQVLTAGGNIIVENGQTFSIVSLPAGQNGSQGLGIVVEGSTVKTVEYQNTAVSSGHGVIQTISSDGPDGPKTTTTSGGDGLGTGSSTAESSSRTESGAASQGNRSVVCTMSLFLLAIVGYIVIV